MNDKRGVQSLFLDLYHTSGKFRLVQRRRPRRVPGRFKPRAQPARKEDQCASSPQPQRRPTKIVLAVLPLETSDATRQKTSRRRAPVTHAVRRQVLVGLQDPPSFPIFASLATEPPPAPRLPECLWHLRGRRPWPRAPRRPSRGASPSGGRSRSSRSSAPRPGRTAGGAA